jgi:hypothetical protein
MAVLDARGTLGETYVAESVLDTRFSGRVAGRTTVGELPAIIPAISGRALDHRLPPARRRPIGPARRRVHAARHVGQRPAAPGPSTPADDARDRRAPGAAARHRHAAMRAPEDGQHCLRGFEPAPRHREDVLAAA